MYTYRAKLNRVVDGDTIDLQVLLGFNININIRVRLYEIDTPEIWGVKKDSEEYSKGLKAKVFVENWFANREFVIVTTRKDKKGKFGRWLGYISAEDNSEVLNEALVASGHAAMVSYG